MGEQPTPLVAWGPPNARCRSCGETMTQSILVLGVVQCGVCVALTVSGVAALVAEVAGAVAILGERERGKTTKP